MRLPSSSSLLLASLVSSSSLSALAAPAGECYEESSSPAVPAPLHSDDTAAAQSNNYLESRGVLPENLAEVIRKLGLCGDKVAPKARAELPAGAGDLLKPITDSLNGIVSGGSAGGKTTRAEESEANGPAGPNGSAKPVAAPVPALPVPAPALPVPVPALPVPAPALPVPVPALPVPAPALPIPVLPPSLLQGTLGKVLSPRIPEIPPNTPVQRGFFSPDPQ